MSSVNADIREPWRTIARVGGHSDSFGHRRRKIIFRCILKGYGHENDRALHSRRRQHMMAPPAERCKINYGTVQPSPRSRRRSLAGAQRWRATVAERDGPCPWWAWESSGGFAIQIVPPVVGSRRYRLSPLFLPNVHSIPPSSRTRPPMCRPMYFSRLGSQGTS